MFQYIEFNLDLFKILFQSFFIKDISTEKSIKEKMWQLMKIKVTRNTKELEQYPFINNICLV